jgi:hypothetical protein
MTEVDAGSGNGAAVSSTPPVDSQPQAQGAPAISKEIADVIASTVSKAVADVKDSIFAEARRTFTGKKETKSKTDDVATQANPPAQFDPFKMRKLDFALTKTGIAADLSQTQYERAHRDFASESPDDAESWIKDYFHGHAKFAAPAPQAATAPVTQPVTQTNSQQRTSPPVSDRGSPPVSSTPLEEQDIIAMSPSDREALRRQKGDKWFTDKLLDQSKRHTFKLR